MNVHRKTFHKGSTKLNNLLGLETCQADKSGPKSSLLEVAAAAVEQPTTNFRNTGAFEAKVGLLKEGILFCEGEASRMGQAVLSFFPKHPENPHHEAVVQFFVHAESLCSRMGSSHVRQQAMRDWEGLVSPKCFHPVQGITAKEYAVTVARFIFFCERADWPGRRTVDAKHTVMDVLCTVLFEPSVLITQTYVTR
jgi:hypothetical protein